MGVQAKKYIISFRPKTKRTFVELARKSIVRKGKDPRTLSRDIDKVLYGA